MSERREDRAEPHPRSGPPPRPVDASPPGSAPTAFVDYLDGLYLLRLVRIRRECRLVTALAVLALPLWAGAIVGVQAATPDGSSLWNLADTAAGPGFIVILIVLVAALIGFVVVRVVGRQTGRMAAWFVPPLARRLEPTVEGDADALRGLLPRLRKKSVLSLGYLFAFLVLAAGCVFGGLNVAPAYQANHGRGGDVVTIGVNAYISSVQSGGRGGPQYFLATPDGTALAEDHKPIDGQRYVVLTQGINPVAYLVGGHDYLLLVGIVVVGAVGAIVFLLLIAVDFRKERRLRAADGHQPLAYSVRRLAAGARPVIRFAGHGPASAIGLLPLPADTDDAARRLVHRRRWGGGLVVIVVIAVVGGVGFLISSPTQPSQSRTDVTLSYLAGSVWATDASVAYDGADALVGNVQDELRAGGVSSPDVGSAWLVILSSQATDPRTQGYYTADVEVAQIGSAPSRAAVAGALADQRQVAAFEHDPTPAPISGLPAGWAGLATDGTHDDPFPEVDAFGAADGFLIDVSIDEPSAARTRLTDLITGLAGIVAHRGIARFAQDTQQ